MLKYYNWMCVNAPRYINIKLIMVAMEIYTLIKQESKSC